MIIVEQRFWIDKLFPAQKKGTNSGVSPLHVDPSSQSRELGKAASKTPITSSRTETLILHEIFRLRLLPFFKPQEPNAICLGIFDSPASSYRSIFLSLGISNRLYIELSQERDTQYQRYYQLQVDYFATSQKDTHLV